MSIPFFLRLVYSLKFRLSKGIEKIVKKNFRNDKAKGIIIKFVPSLDLINYLYRILERVLILESFDHFDREEIKSNNCYCDRINILRTEEERG